MCCIFTLPSRIRLVSLTLVCDICLLVILQPIFKRGGVVPAANAGTKTNPILVDSGEHSRTVGFVDPVTHAVMWFNLDEGALHYVPDLDLYFKLNKL